MTISATGKAGRAGFTILEILLVFFLIALIGTVLIVNIDSVLRDQDEATVERAFWDASREARLQSLLTRQPVVLTYDFENSYFNIRTASGSLAQFPANAVTQSGDPITIRFVQERPKSELVLIRGRLIDTYPIEEVIFYPDGSCTSFWVEVESGGNVRQIRIDPWTGAEMLTRQDT